MIEWLVLLGAAFFAGGLNAIAGGGSFLTFPALIFAGISPVAANATSAVAVFPGYIGAALGFTREIVTFERRRLYRYLVLATLGGLIGSLLLLVSSNTFFSLLIPWLLLMATLLFVLGEHLTLWLKEYDSPVKIPEWVVLLLVSIYGGYFNGGLGIILLAVFIGLGMTDFNIMNGLKNCLSLVLSTVSVITFSLAGIVHWPEAIVMMIAATIGGYSGARIAKSLPPKMVRGMIILVGMSMTLIFFRRYFVAVSG